jgi:hypothetical protein
MNACTHNRKYFSIMCILWKRRFAQCFFSAYIQRPFGLFNYNIFVQLFFQLYSVKSPPTHTSRFTCSRYTVTILLVKSLPLYLATVCSAFTTRNILTTNKVRSYKHTLPDKCFNNFQIQCIFDSKKLNIINFKGNGAFNTHLGF